MDKAMLLFFFLLTFILGVLVGINEGIKLQRKRDEEFPEMFDRETVELLENSLAFDSIADRATNPVWLAAFAYYNECNEIKLSLHASASYDKVLFFIKLNIND